MTRDVSQETGPDDLRSLAERVIDAATGAGKTIGTVESCTGGLLAHMLTSIPGASRAYIGSIIAYDDRIKTALLGVPGDMLRDQGAVSRATAKALAQGGRGALGADVVVATTGIAGPTGGSADKPAGTVWIGCASAATAIAVLHQTGSPARDANLQRFASLALQTLLDALA